MVFLLKNGLEGNQTLDKCFQLFESDALAFDEEPTKKWKL